MIKPSLLLKKSRVALGGLFVLSLTLLFQNCGKSGFDADLDQGNTDFSSLSETFGSRDAAKVAAIPFAYDVIPDTLTYSSCVGANLSNPAGFTFRVGAYATGGVRLRPNFLNYLQTNFQPIAPATSLSLDQMKTYLAYSPENTGAKPQFAIRLTGMPWQVMSFSGAPTVGMDFQNILTNLSDDRVMDPLLRASGNPVSYFPMISIPSQRFLETSLAYNINEARAQEVRQKFQQGAELDFTFTPSYPSSSYASRVPASATDSGGTTDTTQAYGRGLMLTFGSISSAYNSAVYPNELPHVDNPLNMLTGVQEVNLENRSSSAGTGTWNCASNRRFLIVRAEDAGTSCLPDAASSMSDPNYRRELEIVRRHLPEPDWDVSLGAHCVVPKKIKCYDDNYPVEYQQSKACWQTSNQTPSKSCAQYISICVRN